MTRFAPRLMVTLVCAALAVGAGLPGIAKAADADPAQSVDLAKTMGNLDSQVRQAQLLRSQGQFDQAVKILSQLMLVASDDPRVVGEYGKTLAEQGRASEAVQFLTRAAELAPNDWTILSATGVAYDQLGNQAAARTAYEHALALKPGEPSILNNYALSRMLANDPVLARQLAARAQIAGGGTDPKIARNIAMINQLAPTSEVASSSPSSSSPVSPSGLAYAVQKPAPAEMAASAPQKNSPPNQSVATAAPSTTTTGTPTGMPHPLVSQQALADIPAHAASASAGGVVMQAVPEDPLAGPVKPASHAPRMATAAHHAPAETAKSEAKEADAKADQKPAAKPAAKASAPTRTADAKSNAKPAPAKPAKSAVPALRMTADAGNP